MNALKLRDIILLAVAIVAACVWVVAAPDGRMNALDIVAPVVLLAASWAVLQKK